MHKMSGPDGTGDLEETWMWSWFYRTYWERVISTSKRTDCLTVLASVFISADRDAESKFLRNGVLCLFSEG